jgi:SAM-dependent methyltransferase
MMTVAVQAIVSDRASAAPSGHPWDHAAQGWNQHSAVIRAWLKEATAALLDATGIGPGSQVLDIAAGAGDQTLDIAARVGPQGRVLATDISPAILALAQDNARAAGLWQVDTQVADAQALALAGSNFDAAVCRLGLMFCTAPLTALTEARAALRPGGRFAALVFSQPARNPCLVIAMKTALAHAGLPAKPPFEPGTLMSLGEPGALERLLQGAGFVDIGVRPISAPFGMPTSRDYVDFVRTSGSPIMQILAPLSPSAQRDAWADMEAQLNVFTTPIAWEGPNELLLCAASSPTPRGG